MKRISGIFLRVFLIIAIIISLILSWLIWTNNAKYQQGVQVGTVPTVNRRSVVTTRSMNEIFSPTKIIINDAHTQRLIYNYKYSTVREIFQQIKQSRLSRPRQIAVNDSVRYQKLLHQKNSLQLVYPTTLTINTIANLISQKRLQQNPDSDVDRIVLILQGQQQQLYFLNDHNFAIYKVQQRHLNYRRINELVQDNNFSALVDTQVHEHAVHLLFLKPITLKPVSYLITKQSNNNYIFNLLNSKQSSNITTHKVNDRIIYRNGMYRILDVDSRNDLVNFVDYSKTNIPNNVPDILNESYRALVKIGNPLNGTYLYNYDRKNQNLIFRNYVEGFPIFQQSKNGMVKVEFSHNGQNLLFSKKVLQVPVPAEQKSIRLPATVDIITGLKNNGYNIHSIQKVTIGYKWSDDSQNREIVDLIPTYYVRMNNQWKTYADWIN